VAVTLAVWGGGFLVIVLTLLVKRRAGRHGGAMRAGVVGALYEWQNKDKQKALDVIVEGRAEERRPEYPDGNLPDLAAGPGPGGRSPTGFGHRERGGRRSLASGDRGRVPG